MCRSGHFIIMGCFDAFVWIGMLRSPIIVFHVVYWYLLNRPIIMLHLCTLRVSVTLNATLSKSGIWKRGPRLAYSISFQLCPPRCSLPSFGSNLRDLWLYDLACGQKEANLTWHDTVLHKHYGSDSLWIQRSIRVKMINCLFCLIIMNTDGLQSPLQLIKWILANSL